MMIADGTFPSRMHFLEQRKKEWKEIKKSESLVRKSLLSVQMYCSLKGIDIVWLAAAIVKILIL